MRKIQTAAVVATLLGAMSFAGAGTAFAHGGGGVSVGQSTACKSHDLNVDVLGEVGIANGLAGNLLGGEGNPGGQATGLGSSMGCSNDAF
jgi:hypothetical protein